MIPAVALLSGGLDSVTAAADAQSRGYAVRALSVSYGQRHGHAELIAAQRLAKHFGWAHLIIQIPIAQVSYASALTDSDLEIPSGRDVETMATSGVPTTYVPMRNTMLIGAAAGLLESWILDMFGIFGGSAAHEDIQEAAVVIGANAVDFSGYPDCRPQYYDAMRQTLKLGCSLAERGVEVFIDTPLLYDTKAQVISRGHALGVPLGITRSCYAAGPPCGTCDSCLIRAKGFREAGLVDADPVRVRETSGKPA